MGYGVKELLDYKLNIKDMIKKAIFNMSTNEKYSNMDIWIHTTNCTEESFNFGINVFIETKVCIRFSMLKPINKNQIVRVNSIILSNKDCYGVGESNNVFESVASIQDAIELKIDEALGKLPRNDEIKTQKEVTVAELIEVLKSLEDQDRIVRFESCEFAGDIKMSKSIVEREYDRVKYYCIEDIV